MDYAKIQAVLGTRTVDRLEDAVLEAMASVRDSDEEAQLALRQMIVALLGAVILNRSDSQVEIESFVRQCSTDLASVLKAMRPGEPSVVAVGRRAN